MWIILPRDIFNLREREREKGGSVIADCITNPIYLILINASALQLILKIFKWKSTVD